MKKFFKIGLLFFVLAFITVNVQAQKFGYINSTELLEKMPEVQQMRSNLKGLSDQLQKQGQGMLTNYQKQEQAAIDKKSKGEMTPLEEENVMKELQAKQQEIMQFEQEMQQKIVKKEQELLQPIVDRVNTAINTVATENGYQYIFDARPDLGILLYADENQDVTALVKAKLGM